MQGQALEKRTNLYTMALEKLNVMIGNLIHGYPTIKVNHVEREYLQTLEQDNENAAHAEFAKSKTKVRVNMIISLLSVPESETPPAAIPAVAHIDLSDVSFRHEEKVILSHASYRFEAGKKYQILELKDAHLVESV